MFAEEYFWFGNLIWICVGAFLLPCVATQCSVHRATPWDTRAFTLLPPWTAST